MNIQEDNQIVSEPIKKTRGRPRKYPVGTPPYTKVPKSLQKKQGPKPKYESKEEAKRVHLIQVKANQDRYKRTKKCMNIIEWMKQEENSYYVEIIKKALETPIL